MRSVRTLMLTLPVLLWLGAPVQATETSTNVEAAIIARCVEEKGLVYPAMACFGEVMELCVGDQTKSNHMIYCAVQEYMVWVQRLNTAYEEIMKVANTDATASLKRAQRAWDEFRADTCSATALLLTDGTQSSLAMAVCMGNQTAVRSLQLEQFLIEAEI